MTDARLAEALAGDAEAIDADVADRLLAILADPSRSADHRVDAAIALCPVVELGEQAQMMRAPVESCAPVDEATWTRILDALQTRALDPDTPAPVRQAALEIAARAPREWQLDAIRQAAAGDSAWRRVAVSCMGCLPGFEQELLDALEDPDPAIHFEAVVGVGMRQLPDAWPHIARLVRDATGDLRLAAIFSAPGVDPEAAITLLTPYADDPDDTIAEAVDQALAMARALTGDW